MALDNKAIKSPRGDRDGTEFLGRVRTAMSSRTTDDIVAILSTRSGEDQSRWLHESGLPIHPRQAMECGLPGGGQAIWGRSARWHFLRSARLAAALVMLFCVSAPSVSHAAPSQKKKAKKLARKLAKKGAALAKRGDYQGALEAYTKAQDKRPSKKSTRGIVKALSELDDLDRLRTFLSSEIVANRSARSTRWARKRLLGVDEELARRRTREQAKTGQQQRPVPQSPDPSDQMTETVEVDEKDLATALSAPGITTFGGAKAFPIALGAACLALLLVLGGPVRTRWRSDPARVAARVDDGLLKIGMLRTDLWALASDRSEHHADRFLADVVKACNQLAALYQGLSAQNVRKPRELLQRCNHRTFLVATKRALSSRADAIRNELLEVLVALPNAPPPGNAEEDVAEIIVRLEALLGPFEGWVSTLSTWDEAMSEHLQEYVSLAKPSLLRRAKHWVSSGAKNADSQRLAALQEQWRVLGGHWRDFAVAAGEMGPLIKPPLRHYLEQLYVFSVTESLIVHLGDKGRPIAGQIRTVRRVLRTA